jgi:transcriptional regulator with XRE-family HTH domain
MSTRRIARRWGVAIKAQRLRRGMSVAELADALGVSRPTIYDWENGRAAPSPERHVQIANVLGVHPRLLFTYPEEVPA